MNDIVSYVLVNLVRIALIAIFGIISYYGVPLLKTTIIPWLQEKHLYGIVVQMVQAAEKLAESETISKADKKSYVINALTNHGVTVNNYTESLIESAVKELDDKTTALITDACDVLSSENSDTVTAQDGTGEGETTDDASN